MTPYFSIILPIYNVAPYLERCVQSVLEQSFRDYELILVDDGSTDESSEICDRLGAQHSCIRVIHKENGGLSSARNAGLEIAQGEYIWWVDSDDWIAENALTILYEASATEKPDMVKYNFARVRKDEQPFYSNARPGFYMEEETEVLLDSALLMPSRFGLSAWSHSYRRDFLEKNKLTFTSERMIGSEDYLFNLQALAVVQSIRVIADQLYFYELRGGSLSQSYKKDLSDRYILLYSLLRQFYAEKCLLDRYEQKICRFFAWHLIRGTCISNEYQGRIHHSVKQARRNVRSMLQIPEVSYAARRCDCTGLNWRKKIQIWAMLWRCEFVFYRLHVKK